MKPNPGAITIWGIHNYRGQDYWGHKYMMEPNPWAMTIGAITIGAMSV